MAKSLTPVVERSGFEDPRATLEDPTTLLPVAPGVARSSIERGFMAEFVCCYALREPE
jgi:hypothetical protein